MVGKAEAAAEVKGGETVVRRTVCTHCSVGCSVDAVVQNGVWVRQEPVFDSPINLGAHCAKGAAVRENAHGEKRVKYPMKLEGGKWKRITWEQAINDVGDKLLALRKESGPDAVFWIGSSKHNNEQAYLLRKFVSMWGSNNCDHQARICHSTTVAGVANTWGYGAMTNSYNDMQNSKCILYLGSNAAEAHPVSMLHTLHAKEKGCKIIVVDPRFTRTAAKADLYFRHRSGTDVALINGMLWHIFKNGWEDKAFIQARVYGMDKVREEVAKYPPEVVQEITGVKGEDVHTIAKTMYENRPSTIVWAMGQTQHTIGSAIVRASCILQLALGNMGKSGGGTNIYRGHDNVQGATDVGPNPDSLPGYYGIAEGSWKYWSKVWGVDYEWLKGRFASKAMMETSGITVSRWIDGVLEKNDLINQDSNLRGIVYWGHAPNSQTRGLEMVEAMKKLDLLVIIDPFPSATAAMAALARTDNVYILPATTQFETQGSATCSNRSLQWREKVMDPLFESKPDHVIMYLLAKKFGFEKELTKNIKVNGDEPNTEDTLREINRSVWTIGYTGQSPERLKLHMKNQQTFDPTTLLARGGPCDGEYYGLPWPCWGTPEMKHPGTPEPLRHVEGGQGRRSVLPRQLRRRARWGQPAGRGWFLSEERRPHHRLSRVRPRSPQEAGLVGRSHGRREGGGRGQELEDRHVGRHHPRRDQARLRARSATPRRGRSCGTSPIPSRFTGSRSSRPGPTWWRSTRPTTTRRRSGGCRRSTRRCRRSSRTSPRSTRLSSPAAVSSSTRAAATRRGPTRGSRSCSRTCSSRSTRRTPTTRACATASTSGSRRRPRRG